MINSLVIMQSFALQSKNMHTLVCRFDFCLSFAYWLVCSLARSFERSMASLASLAASDRLVWAPVQWEMAVNGQRWRATEMTVTDISDRLHSLDNINSIVSSLDTCLKWAASDADTVSLARLARWLRDWSDWSHWSDVVSGVVSGVVVL